MGRSRVKIDMSLMLVAVELADESTHRQWSGEKKDPKQAGLIVKVPTKKIVKRYVKNLVNTDSDEVEKLAVSLVLSMINDETH